MTLACHVRRITLGNLKRRHRYVVLRSRSRYADIGLLVFQVFFKSMRSRARSLPVTERESRGEPQTFLFSAVASLRANAVPPMQDGTYHVILDDISHRQLMADSDFKIYFASRQDSPVIKRQDVYIMFGMTFIPTTNAYVQLPATDAGGGTGGTGISQVTTTIRRPIVLGAECLIEGNFEGLETFLTRQGVSPIADTMMVDNVLQIVRPPIDRLNQFASLSWHWIGDYAVPTDITATTQIIPTASNAAWKRAIVLEHAG